MLQILHFLLALMTIAILALLALLASRDRKSIKLRYIFQLLIIEIALAYFFLHSESGLGAITYFAGLFEVLMKFTAVGTSFVFGNMNEQGLAFIFLNVLCPIIFVSALIGILQHFRILPLIIRVVGTLLSKVNGMGKSEIKGQAFARELHCQSFTVRNSPLKIDAHTGINTHHRLLCKLLFIAGAQSFNVSIFIIFMDKHQRLATLVGYTAIIS